MNNVFVLLTDSLTLFIICTFSLPERLKPFPSLCIFLQISIFLSVFSFWPKLSAAFAVCGAFLLVFLFSSLKLLNVYCSVLAYLFHKAVNLLMIYAIYMQTGITPVGMYYEYAFLYMTGSLIFNFILSAFLGWILRSKIKIQDLNVDIRLLTVEFLNLAAGTALFNFYFSYTERIAYPPEASRLNTVLFLFYFLFSSISTISMIWIQKRENLLKQRLESQKQLENYVQSLELLYQDMRSFRHDYQNILSTMEGYFMDNDMPGLDNWFHHSILPLSDRTFPLFGIITELTNIRITELKGLFYAKGISAVSVGISLHLDIPYPVTGLTADILDICTVLGIFLDNAIEAVQNCEKGEIAVSMLQEEHLLIMIRNTCQELPLPLSELTVPGVTTKGEGRGLGLAKAERLLCKYPFVVHTCSWKDGYFEQLLENM